MKLMRSLSVTLAVAALLPAPVMSQTSSVRRNDSSIVLVTVTKDRSKLTGGTGARNVGKALLIGPVARYRDGEWSSLGCDRYHDSKCESRERRFAKQPRDYTIVTPERWGAVLHGGKWQTSECIGLNAASAKLEEGDLKETGIAASDGEAFSSVDQPKVMEGQKAKELRHFLQRRVPEKLDTAQGIHLLELQLEGSSFWVAQRTFDDREASGRTEVAFIIGTEVSGRLQVLRASVKDTDQQEQIVGVIRMKSGREFLVTNVSDLEGQWFRIYGMVGGKLKLVYQGGGTTC